MTHTDLIKFGRKYMASKAPVVVTELKSGAGEEPDIIAFLTNYKIGAGTVIIECKVTRQDFHKDKKKVYRRRPELAMGDYRYYLVPKSLITVDEVPEKWGLLEASAKGRIKILKKAERQKVCNKQSEVLLLVSLVRRLDILPGKHISLRTYVHETKNKATLTTTDRI